MFYVVKGNSMIIKVRITAKNIEDATIGDCNSCVLAKKVNKVLSARYKARVTSVKLDIFDKKLLKYVHHGFLSQKNINIIGDFDFGKLKPCETLLNIPKRFLKQSVANS